MSKLNQYHLHAFAHAKLHFEVYDAKSYLATRMEKASRPHRHSYYQLIWFKTAGNHYIDYEVVEHPANAVFMINKNQVHHFCRDSPNEGILFHFNDIFIVEQNPDLLDRWSLTLFSEMVTHYVILDQEVIEKVDRFTGLIREEAAKQDKFYAEAIFHLFAAIMVILERKLDVLSLNKTFSDAFMLASKFKKLVVDNIEHFWSIDEFAERLNITTKVLTKATKEVLYQTPAKIITDLKVLEAKRMLSNQSLSVKEIGYRLGFEQATYFTKYFKKVTGVTPRAFQRALQ
ncbi:MAG: AraC family transcriptional regulator [Cytophagales bacterium]|nr:AraC family transcriptional regulator [Cytophagales bacterium]